MACSNMSYMGRNLINRQKNYVIQTSFIIQERSGSRHSVTSYFRPATPALFTAKAVHNDISWFLTLSSFFSNSTFFLFQFLQILLCWNIYFHTFPQLVLVLPVYDFHSTKIPVCINVSFSSSFDSDTCACYFFYFFLFYYFHPCLLHLWSRSASLMFNVQVGKVV